MNNGNIACTHLPTIISSTSEAFFRILLQMSMVKMVLLLLKIDVRDEIKADIITASIRPENMQQLYLLGPSYLYI